MALDPRNIETDVITERIDAVVDAIGNVLQGKQDVIRLALVCLLGEGHLLIEDVPGVGKTSLAKALAAVLDCQSSRIQFTPDLLPSDVTGVTVYDRATGRFEFVRVRFSRTSFSATRSTVPRRRHRRRCSRQWPSDK